ncbi:MAG: hypothetical protein R3F46_14005 [bacterium]
MWKGLAWLMLLYGLLATAAAVDAGDKQKGTESRCSAVDHQLLKRAERAHGE